MSRVEERGFDCIRFVREVRAEIAAETEGMTPAERVQYYRNYPYDDPVLQEMVAPLRNADKTTDNTKQD